MVRKTNWHHVFSVLTILTLNCLDLSAQSNKVGIESEKINGEYIGGVRLDGLNTPIFSKAITTGDYVVNTKSELLEALIKAKRGQVIFISGNSVIDLTGENKIRIPHGITLASDRGHNRAKGAIIQTNLHGVSPLLRINGNNVKITGIRLSGPDTAVYYDINDLTQSISPIDLAKLKREKDDYQVKKDALPRSTGISIEGTNVEIYNCEIYGWTNAAIQVSPSAKNTVVHHNYIHHNQHFGLGYGVLLYKSSAKITANLFDYNNHSVTGTGHVGTSFEVANNIFKENHIRAWPIDMHGGVDRKDGTDIAGDSFIVHNNDFYLHFGRPGINIRGVPQEESKIYDNKFTYLTKERNIKAYQSRRKALGVAVRIDANSKFDTSTAIRIKGNQTKAYNNEIIERN